MKPKIEWIHQIALPDGSVTPGIWKPMFEEWDLSDIDFKNKRVLDIGCLDGQYSLYAEKAGAKEVVAIDIIETEKNEKSYPQGSCTNEAFLYAHKTLKSNVKYIFPYSIYDATPEQFGTFDVVFFLGVLYHLAHPLYALEKINKLLPKQGLMVLESEISRSFTQFYNKNHLKHNLSSSHAAKQNASSSLKAGIKTKLLQLVRRSFDVANEKEVYNNDTSIFWVPTMPVLERFLDFSGFAIEKKVDDGVSSRAIYICRKVEEPSQIYAVESMYSQYKKRFTNFTFMGRDKR